jgi:hypothetical protein
MAKNGKMVILPGTSDPSGNAKLPDELGKPAKWPFGALHVRAAEDFARKRGYEPVTLRAGGQQSGDHGKQVQEFLKLFAGLSWSRKSSYENDMELNPDSDIHALYGFSGGAYNVWYILQFLAEKQPNDLQRIDLVVVLGVDRIYKRKVDYAWPQYQAIAIKHRVTSGAWNKDKWKNGWETIYHTNPDKRLLPTTLPKEIRDKADKDFIHMFGPDVLVAGTWPDET